MIVQNAADTLGEALESISWADELIVYDSGSSDETPRIAKEHNAHFYSDTHWEGFGRQRQKAQAKATGEWIFMLDADEVVTPELKKSILEAVNGSVTFSYRAARLTHSFGGPIRFGGWYPDYVERLYPASKAAFNDALVHETVRHIEPLQVKNLKGDLIHYSYRSLDHYLEKSNRYAREWAVGKLARNKRTSMPYTFFYVIFQFCKMYFVRLGFLDGSRGFLIAFLSSHSAFLKQAHLWLMQKEQKKG